MPDQHLDTKSQRVTVKTPRGNLTIGPNGQIDGLWRIAQRELRTNDQVRELAGGVTRHTLIAWRNRKTDPFPPPVVRLPAGATTIELWSRTMVEDWLARRDA